MLSWLPSLLQYSFFITFVLKNDEECEASIPIPHRTVYKMLAACKLWKQSKRKEQLGTELNSM